MLVTRSSDLQSRNTSDQESQTFCVIGAGPAGLTAIKNFKQRSINVDCLECRSDLGGLWNLDPGPTAVYPDVSMITSKRLSAFVDHPMPSGLPPFPNRSEALQYLRSYADRFRLRDHIEFGKRVELAMPLDVGWQVHVAGEARPRHYAGIVVASGHHWDPLWPTWNGTFNGRLIHAIDYEHAEEFRDQRVLVVGGGNSGCDICSEIARYAQRTLLSSRRGYHFLPKFLLGAPIDRCGEGLAKYRLPKFVYRAIASIFLKVAVGSPMRYGLPKPDHRLFEAHPIINSRLLDDLGHGRVVIKPDVASLAGDRVTFADDSSEELDTIVCATGYRASFPFLTGNVMPDLYLNIFDRTRDDFFAVGLIQPNGSIWSLADHQSQLVAEFITASRCGKKPADAFRARKRTGQTNGPIDYLATERHRFEVEYFHYRQTLQNELRGLS